MKKKVTSLIVSIFSGLFGSWGGAEGTSKGWRRFGVSGLLATVGGFYKKSFKPTIISFWSVIMSMGYGIPDATDEGSTLGRFWFKIFKGNRKFTDLGVKFTLGSLFSVVLVGLGFLQNNLGTLKITVPIAIGSHVVFGGFIEKMGEFSLFGKKLTFIEFFRYGFLGLAGIIQILF